MEGIKGNCVGREDVEEERLDVVGCGVVGDVDTAVEGFTFGGIYVLVLAFGEDDERGVYESVGEEVALDDGTDVVEDYLTVVGIERGGEDGSAATLDGDVKGGCVGGDGDGRGERRGENVLGRCVLDVYHCGFFLRR